MTRAKVVDSIAMVVAGWTVDNHARLVENDVIELDKALRLRLATIREKLVILERLDALDAQGI